MGDTDEMSDIRAYIRSSKYRLTVLEHLFDRGDATPTEIAERADVRQPHVSRALSELEDRDVVELRVSESRRVKRYYGLTERGRDVWSVIRENAESIEWFSAEPSGPAMRSVVELAREEFGDYLRLVVAFDGETVRILHDEDDVLADYSDEEFERGARNLLLEHSIETLELSDQECWSEVMRFGSFSVLKVLYGDGQRVMISFENDHDVRVPSFSEDVVSLLS
ncbi:MarR family winged helix-turn-helix transcriptional regulator [Halorubrum cibi]|uniref:Helix-turn-helix domain-containing protein n=1 Tax=Halorubrum cibi TaxID=413815 RepID=A0A521CTF2_9EURY|nr:MarR family winged helix-turn-helix transcriptional regulator [Halorubrum cibi]SMO62693.1 Helix-turn-helix domain-containing protein [Halorubrum cibi]